MDEAHTRETGTGGAGFHVGAESVTVRRVAPVGPAVRLDL
jgi:hypothetical protein